MFCPMSMWLCQVFSPNEIPKISQPIIKSHFIIGNHFLQSRKTLSLHATETGLSSGLMG